PEAPDVGGETDEEPETHGPPRLLPVTMWGPPAILLAASVAIAVAPGARHVAHDAAARMLDSRGTAAHVLEGAPQPTPPAASAARHTGSRLGAGTLRRDARAPRRRHLRALPRRLFETAAPSRAGRNGQEGDGCARIFHVVAAARCRRGGLARGSRVRQSDSQ